MDLYSVGSYTLFHVRTGNLQVFSLYYWCKDQRSLRLRVPTSHHSSPVGIMDVSVFDSAYSVSLKTGGIAPCSLNSNGGEHLIRICYG